MQSKCNVCGDVHEVVSRDKKKPRGVVVSYIECPVCKEKNIYSVTDMRVRNRQKKIRVLQNQYRLVTRGKRKEKLMNEYRKVKGELSVIMKELLDIEREILNRTGEIG
ncbi:hypothetical protein P5667_15625 [Bacillus velezensis]|uniref:hypothetical protein n=1 Tax=Bacillus amyloliquefaciens group TaxID=1938374 RepID=UPI000396CE19|nr:MULTISPECIES: hypothetical protein [Bacillus amyloliquefaciens group]ERH55285.1 hypothetical protein O205_21215 [Bacillus amyloliquefaciens EGD-AQ14]MDH3087217.1 hypothetical protein [Bacillus velezensis]PKF83679.1 hypothetical protein CWI74_07295 [Bacillus velezensis]WEY80393.1 hypothetical protein P5667_15625 [Bacillus velezensis]WPB65703.1 hypothetical protein SBK94_15075 [Bacillus velezensis]